MTTFIDLLTSLKNELQARYKSPFWGAALIALVFYHWKIVLFMLLERPHAADAIAFIENNSSISSVVTSLGVAIFYIIAFPWFELVLSKARSTGIRKRNDFQIRERARENNQRQQIVNDEAQTIEKAFKNKEEQSRLADIGLVQSYQSTLSGENFTRWLKDVERGALNYNLNNVASNYLNKADSVEGKFINPSVQKAHEKFLEALSAFDSASNDYRANTDEEKKKFLPQFAREAYEAHQAYRDEARKQLNI